MAMEIETPEQAKDLALRHVPGVWSVQPTQYAGEFALYSVTWSGAIEPMKDAPNGRIFVGTCREPYAGYYVGNSFAWERFSDSGHWLESGGIGVYWTLSLPFAGLPKPSPWHPDKETGPFSTLSSGCFRSEEAAHTWAREKLNGGPYRVRFVCEE